jgi:hypothetical protein
MFLVSLDWLTYTITPFASPRTAGRRSRSIRAVCRAAREWALANPNEYALIYGTPVPGYVAPPATIASAARAYAVLLRILADAVVSGSLTPAASADEVSPGVRGALAPARSVVPADVPDGSAPNLASAWLTSFAIGVAVAIPTAILIAPSARRLPGRLTGTTPAHRLARNDWAMQRLWPRQRA